MKQNSEVDEIFKFWLSNRKEKKFDLTKSKDELLLDLYQRLVNGDYETLNDLALGIAKSYHANDPESISKYVKKLDLMLNNPIGIVNKFFNEHILDESTVFEKSEDIWTAYAKVIAEKFPKFYGNVTYIDLTSMSFDFKDRISLAVNKAMKEKGFMPNKFDGNLFINKTFSKSNGKNQSLLLMAYCDLVDRYVGKFDKIIPKKPKEDDFNNFCNAIQTLFSNLENEMTKETKSNPLFIMKNKSVKKFLNEHRPILHTINFGDSEVYRCRVREALNHIKDSENKEKIKDEDKSVAEEFYGRLKKLNKAFKISDKDGIFPVNYYAIMPLHVKTCFALVDSLQKSGYLSKQDSTELYQVKSVLNRFKQDRQITSVDLQGMAQDNFFKEYRCKIRTSENVVDLTDEENYKLFKDMVIETMQEYNLPYFDTCIKGVAYNLARARRPINLGDEDQGHEAYDKKFKKYCSKVANPVMKEDRVK